MSYRCAVCGGVHDDIPDLGADRPDMWWGIPEAERDDRIVLTSDTCVIDEKDYFIRGVIEIPVHDAPHPFGIGVWVSQKRENFVAYLRAPDSDQIGPFFGWLCTRIRYYAEDTLFLKTMAHFPGGDLRPRIEIEPTDHPLAVDQREGITIDKVWEIVHHCGGRA
jgi:hypothetical protein